MRKVASAIQTCPLVICDPLNGVSDGSDSDLALGDTCFGLMQAFSHRLGAPSLSGNESLSRDTENVRGYPYAPSGLCPPPPG